MKYISIGNEFTGQTGLWVGAKVGLFAVRSDASRSTHAEVDWFRIESSASK